MSDITDAVAPNPPAFSVPEKFVDWQTTPVAPWRRYGARLLDIMVSGGVAWLFLAFLFVIAAPVWAEKFFKLLEGPAGSFADIFMTVMLSCIINALLIAFVGTSLGKAIFGIKVLSNQGGSLRLGESFAREFSLWFRGLACGVPIVNLATMLAAEKRLRKTGSTLWDDGRFTVIYRRPGALQTALNLLGVAMIVAMRAGINALDKLN